MRIAREEIFGPVLSVIRYESEEEAIAIANDSMYGLAGGVWSKDIGRAEKVAAQVRTGTPCGSTTTMSLPTECPLAL